MGVSHTLGIAIYVLCTKSDQKPGTYIYMIMINYFLIFIPGGPSSSSRHHSRHHRHHRPKHAVHWFRKGLRLSDNPALRRAMTNSDTWRCIFILDPWFAGCSNQGLYVFFI